MSNEVKPLVDDMRAWLESDTDRVIAERDKLAASHAELREALSIAQATLPHIGGNSASTHSLMARINAALTRAREVTK